MRVIARSTVRRFLDTVAGQKGHRAVETALQAWLHEAERARWETPVDVKKAYATASVIDGDRVVFNIKGNDYRLVTAIDYARQAVFIKWIGSHAEYDKIDVRTVQYGDQAYQKQRQPR